MFLSDPLSVLKASLLTILISLTVLISLAVSTITLANPDELLLNGGFEEKMSLIVMVSPIFG